MACSKSFGYIFIHLIELLVVKECICARVSTPDNPDTDDAWTTINYWPNGVIQYLLPDTMYDENERGLIISAMKRWEYTTCIKFVPWTQSMLKEYGEARYINFFSAGSCFSRAGMEKNQPQLFGIGKNCLEMSTIIHELGHTIGLVHTMERIDRDMYIDILYDNMNEASRRNFLKTDSKKNVYPLHDTPYDYKSIMHYGPKAWSKNKQPVVVSKDPAYQHVIGQGDDVSFYDALYVNRAYSCNARCSKTQRQVICQNGGFIGGSDCRCICQDGYMGEFCDTTIQGFEHIIVWKCQKEWVYHDGKCYHFNTETSVSFNRAKVACMLAKASLVIVKDRPEQQWLSHRTEEVKLTTGRKSFWIGLTRAAGASIATWSDRTFTDRNLISIVDNLTINQTACASFDGETATLKDCNGDTGTGYICEKDFDASCGGRYVITNTPTFIQSPGYPNGYPDGIKCTYVLQTDDGSTLKMDFADFQLDRNEKFNDFLEVVLENNVTVDGTRYTLSALKGSNLQSAGNLAILTFKSDGSLSGTGFRVNVTKMNTETIKDVPMSLMTAIRNVFGIQDGDQKTVEAANRWGFNALYKLIQSMTFSKVLK